MRVRSRRSKPATHSTPSFRPLRRCSSRLLATVMHVRRFRRAPSIGSPQPSRRPLAPGAAVCALGRSVPGPRGAAAQLAAASRPRCAPAVRQFSDGPVVSAVELLRPIQPSAKPKADPRRQATRLASAARIKGFLDAHGRPDARACTIPMCRACLAAREITCSVANSARKFVANHWMTVARTQPSLTIMNRHGGVCFQRLAR
jgi:hypothetical protein